MPTLELMLIKKKLILKDAIDKSFLTEFLPGEVILLNDQIRLSYERKLNGANLNNLVEFIPVDQILKPFDINRDKKCTSVVIRSGGIGDLLALSTVCEQLPGRVNFVTQSKYFDVFNWYRNRVNLYDMTKPIFTAFTYRKSMEVANTFRYVKFEDAVEKGARENWYHIFYKSIGMDIKPELCRPILSRSYKIDENIYNGKSILLVHRSTANMRSMSLETMYKAVNNVFPKHNVYVHNAILTAKDAEFAENNDIFTITANTVAEYLEDVYNVDMVVSVDSAAIHFREGVQKPAIGIYNAFTAECRTKYYRTTKSFDISPVCEKQPCFLHQTKIDENCEFAEIGHTEAPCFGKLNKNIVAELTEKIRSSL